MIFQFFLLALSVYLFFGSYLVLIDVYLQKKLKKGFRKPLPLYKTLHLSVGKI